jgi:hypothetical protein
MTWHIACAVGCVQHGPGHRMNKQVGVFMLSVASTAWKLLCLSD